MSRYAHRVDTTHATIRDGMRQLGASVEDTSAVGNDFPDLIVGWMDRTVLVECKTPTRKDGGVKPSATSDGQRNFAANWKGDKVIQATCVADVLAEFRGFR